MITSISSLFASKICDLFACSSFVMARKALVRSEAGRSWEASNASFATRAIDSVSPMRLSTLMNLSKRSVGNLRVRMSGRGKNAIDADGVSRSRWSHAVSRRVSRS
jgi:hypothetical protein